MLNVVYGTVYTLCLYCTYLKKCLSNLTFYMASVDREERVPKTRRFKALLAGRIWAYILCCWGKKIQDDGFGLRRNTITNNRTVKLLKLSSSSSFQER